MAYKINDLTGLGRNLASNDLLEVSLVGGTGSRKMTGSQLIGGVVNPSDTYIPVNNSGTFANSSLRVYPDNMYGTGIPFGIYNIGNPMFGGSPNLNIDDNNGLYSFGNASANNYFSTSAFMGIAFSSGIAIMGCAMSSPSNGVFKADGNNGFVRIGTSDDTSIGVDLINQKFRVGSNLITTGTHVTISRWLKVVNESGTSYYLPLYS